MKFTKKNIVMFALPVAIMVVLVATLTGLQVVFDGQVAPGTTLYGANIAFRNADEVREAYRQSLDRFELAPITVNDQVFTLAELGVTLEKEKSLEQIPVIGLGNFEWGKKVETQFSLDEGALNRALESRIIDLNLRVQDAQFKWNKNRKDFDILPEQPGWHGDMETFKSNFRANIQTLSSEPLTILRIADAPQVTAVRLEAARGAIKDRVEEPLTLKGAYDEWTIDWRDNMDFLKTDPPASFAPSTDYGLQTTDFFIAHVKTAIAPEVEVPSQDVTITRGEDEKIQFEGTATDGITIDYSTLAHLVNLALSEHLTTVDIPTHTTRGRVNAPADLQALGITELVATGYSGFKSSPPGRRHNINVAIKRFDGLLVEPGEIFSFGEHLGEVDGSTGYVKELVIREGQTIPEYGGGVCQVSSTLFRAMLLGGFPIVERHPHSYAVTYYAYPLGWGLDATVYPPTVDLKFKNDMPTPILIQSWAEGNEATFKFYGTKDGRTVTMDGPYITNRKSAPPPIYATTDTLPPGVKEKKDTAHNGFTATWDRAVTYPATHPSRPETGTMKDTIISPYIPWPERWLVGQEETP